MANFCNPCTVRHTIEQREHLVRGCQFYRTFLHEHPAYSSCPSCSYISLKSFQPGHLAQPKIHKLFQVQSNRKMEVLSRKLPLIFNRCSKKQLILWLIKKLLQTALPLFFLERFFGQMGAFRRFFQTLSLLRLTIELNCKLRS